MSRDHASPSEEVPGDVPRLDLSYPCEWRYRVIGSDAARVRDAITAVAGRAKHEIRAGNTSRGGSYVSLELSVTVRDEAHRHRIFAELAAHEHIRFVL